MKKRAHYIQELVNELNRLEQEYGRRLEERDPNYDPSGEVRARIQILKQELNQMGIRLEWDGWQYQIVKEDK